MNDEIKEILDKINDGNWYSAKDLTGTEWLELTWERNSYIIRLHN